MKVKKNILCRFLMFSLLGSSVAIVPIVTTSCSVSFNDLKLKSEIDMGKNLPAISFLTEGLKRYLGNSTSQEDIKLIDPTNYASSSEISSVDFAKSIKECFDLGEYMKRPSQLFDEWTSSNSLPNGLQIYFVGKNFKIETNFVSYGKDITKFKATEFWQFKTLTSSNKNKINESKYIITLNVLMILGDSKKLSKLELIFSKIK